MSTISLRPASPEDGPVLQDIERRAGERFADVGMPEIAEDDPLPLEVLARYATAGRSWVALDPEGKCMGYLLADEVDGGCHIEQVSVSPEHQGAGVGRALLACAGDWARQRGMTALTLTTFTDVPWNATLYAHLGFRVLAEEEIGPGLRAVRAEEAAHGLDPNARVCMRLDLM